MQTQKGAQMLRMTVSHWILYAAGLLLIQGTQSSPPPFPCPESCLCQKGPLVNCSSAGIFLAQKDIPSSVTELDFSHNLLNSFSPLRPSWGLKNLWIGHNRLTHLSLCVEGPWRVKRGRRTFSHSRGRCLSWAPALQLLSVERNQLETIPEGIGGSEFLQVLQISHNRISDLRPGDLSGNPLLRELHLQHNRISSLNPLALKDTPKLRVLDLSFNLLTTIPSSAYLALRHLNSFVEVSGNRWKCDCSLRSVRRWMAYDRDRNQKQTWSGVVCSYPSAHVGRDLLHLEDDDLTCSTAENRTGLHQDVTVDTGTDILLPCGSPNQDSTWWTPNGQVPGSQNGLLIRDIAEKDLGLYVCVSGPDDESVSVFDLHIHKTLRERGTRSLHKDRIQSSPEFSSLQSKDQKNLQKTAWTQSDLVLAVCLSVFITLIVAFILGALARPLLDVLWKRYCRCCKCTKKSPAQAQSVTTAERGPYDNNAYSDDEEDVETHRERRVTFSGHPSELSDHNSVPYYDTVANAKQGNLTGECDIAQEKDTSHPRATDSVSSSSSQQDSRETDTNTGERHLSDVSLSMEFEPIPEPDELQGNHSSSESSHSDQERSDTGLDMDWPNDNLAQRLKEQKTQNNPWQPQSPTKEDDSIEQHSDRRRTMDESILLNPDLWNDSGESFEFSDSIRTASGRSSCQDLSGSALITHPNKSEKALTDEPLATDEREIDISSSSSSCDSGNEPTEYTVNPETDAPKENTLPTWEICPDPGVKSYPKHDVSLDEQLSDSSSDRGGEPTTNTVNESYEEERHDANNDPSLRFGDIKVSFAPRKAVNIEISKEGTQYLPEPETRWIGEISTKQFYPQPFMPSDGAQFEEPPVPVFIPRFGKRLDIQSPQETTTPKTPPPSEYSSSSESDIEATENSVKLDREVPYVSQNDLLPNPRDINISISPRKALKIGFSKEGLKYQPEPEKSLSTVTPNKLPPQHALTKGSRAGDFPVYIPSFRRHLDVQSPHEILPAAPSSPPPAGLSSSSSECEDEKAKIDSSFSLAGVDVFFAPRRALTIGFSKDGIQYQSDPYSQQTLPATPSSPPPAGYSSSSSESEDETKMYKETETVKANVPGFSFIPTGIDVSFAPRRALNFGFTKDGIHYQSDLEKKSTGLNLASQSAISTKKPSMPSDGVHVGDPPVPVYIPRFSKSPSQEDKTASSKTPTRTEYSSSSESDIESTENSQEPDTEVPDISHTDNIFNPGDINISIAPRKALNITFPRESFQYQPELATSSPILGLSSQNAVTPKETLPQHPLPAESRAGEFPVYNPSFRRRLDIQSPHEIPPAAPHSPPPVGSSSSSESEDEMTTNQREEEKAKIPSLAGVGVSFAPRKALNIGFSMDGIQYQSDPYSQQTPPATPGSSPPAGSSSSSESEDESKMYQKREEEGKREPESSFVPAGPDISFAPRRALDMDFSKENSYHPHPEAKSKLSGLGLTSQTAVCITDGGFDVDTKPLSQLSLPKTPLSSSSLYRKKAEESPNPQLVFAPHLGKHLDIQLPQEASPTAPRTQQSSGSSSSSSDSENERTRKTSEDKATVPDDIYQRLSHSPGDTPINVSFTQKKALNIGFSKEGFQYHLSESEPRYDSTASERLKVLSEMRQWDTNDNSTDVNVSFAPKRYHTMNFDASDSSTDQVSQRASAEHIRPMQSNRKDGAFKEVTNHLQTQSLPKTSRFFSTPTPTDGSGPRQSPLQIPCHRRRLVVGIQPPLTPPAVPGTPPPLSPEREEAAGTGWRSRGQQRRAMDGFGQTSMTEGEEKRYMGLTTAKPFGTAHPYQRSITSETVMTTQGVDISDRDGSDMSISASTLHLKTHKEGSEAKTNVS